MKLKDTYAAKKWISQFDIIDYDVASAILEKVDYYTVSDIRNGISRIVREFKSVEEYVAFYPVIDPILDDNGCFLEDYWERLDQQRINTRNIGSDGEIYHLIRDICSGSKNNNFLNQPTLSELKAVKCHKIVVVNDLNCSGSQISLFVNWLYSNKTIKSWKSLKRITFYTVCFAATEYGNRLLNNEKLIEKNFYQVKINTVEDLPNIYRTKAEALIRKIDTRKTFKKNFSQFGYKSIGSLILLSYKNPNTNISILYSLKKWKGLCSNKKYPSLSFKGVKNFESEIELILKKYELSYFHFPKEREFVKFLIINKFFYNNEHLLNKYLVSLDSSDLEEFNYFSFYYGFRNKDGITDKTNKLLNKLQKKETAVTIDPEIENKYYIPSSFGNPS